MEWEDRFRQAVVKHWQHHGGCESVAWWHERDIFDGDVYFAAPVHQEVVGGGKLDGELVWVGFRFALTEFVKTESLTIKGIEVASYCYKCCPHPAMEIVGTFDEQDFILIVLLEPKRDSEAIELLDINTKTIRKKETQP